MNPTCPQCGKFVEDAGTVPCLCPSCGGGLLPETEYLPSTPAPRAVPRASAAAMETIGGYQLLRRLGQGGMGAAATLRRAARGGNKEDGRWRWESGRASSKMNCSSRRTGWQFFNGLLVPVRLIRKVTKKSGVSWTWNRNYRNPRMLMGFWGLAPLAVASSSLPIRGDQLRQTKDSKIRVQRHSPQRLLRQKLVLPGGLTISAEKHRGRVMLRIEVPEGEL